MTDRELVAIMAAILAAGCRADGGPIIVEEAVDSAMRILNVVETGAKELL